MTRRVGQPAIARAHPLSSPNRNEASSLLVKPDPDTQRARSQWYATGKRLVRWPWNAGVVVLVAAATVPFAMNAFDFSTSDNMVDDLPRGAVRRLRGCDSDYRAPLGVMSHIRRYPVLLLPPPPLGGFCSCFQPTTVAFEHMIDDFGYGTVFPCA